LSTFDLFNSISDDDLSELALNIILLGKYKFEYKEKEYYMKLLTAKDKSKIKIEIFNAKQKYKIDKMIENDELVKESIKRGTWNALSQRQLKDLPKKISRMEKSIAVNGEFFARKERVVIERLIESAKKKFKEVEGKYLSIVENSLETELKLFELKLTMQYSFFNHNSGEKIFGHPSDVKFNGEYDFFVGVLDKILGLFTEKTVRKVARNNIWFSVYSSGKSEAFGIWGKHGSDLSDEQLLLLSWTRRYENIYKDPDAPDESVIGDDKFLDQWIQNKEDEFKREKKKRGVNSPTGSKDFVPNSPFDRREVYIMSDKEHANEIYDMNGPRERAKIKSEQKTISKNNVISDGKLRVFK